MGRSVIYHVNDFVLFLVPTPVHVERVPEPKIADPVVLRYESVEITIISCLKTH